VMEAEQEAAGNNQNNAKRELRRYQLKC
jgi:hypothetical protein